MKAVAKAGRHARSRGLLSVAAVGLAAASVLPSVTPARATAATDTTAKLTTTTRRPASYGKLASPKPSPTLSVAFAAPTGVLKALGESTELRWLFDRPVVELTSEDRGPSPSTFVKIDPPLSGEFRWASTRMLVFTPTGKLANSTKYSATVSALKALDATTLAVPFTTTFSTPTVLCQSLGAIDDVGQTLMIDCDQPVDDKSLAAATSVVYRPVAVKASRYRPTGDDLALIAKADKTGLAKLNAYLDAVGARPNPVNTFAVVSKGTRQCAPGEQRQCYLLAIQGAIPVDAVGRVEFKAGIRSLEGPLPGRKRTSGRIPTFRTPVVVTTGCHVACSPSNDVGVEVVGLDPTINGAIDRISIQDVTGGKAGKIQTFRLPAGVTAGEVQTTDDSSLYKYRSPLAFDWATSEPGRTYRITLDPNLADSHARTLGYRSITTVGFGRSGGFAVIGSGERVMVPSASGIRLRSTNVTEIDKVERTLSANELVDVVRSYAAYPKSTPLNLDAEKSSRVKISTPIDEPKAQSLPVGKKGAKGVTLVGVRAATYRAGSRYNEDGRPWTTADDKAEKTLRAEAKKSGTGPDGFGWSSVLVQRTDLGVTLKVSPVNVHVSVTSLATSKAVGGAKVKLFTAKGSKPLFSGTTDASGFVLSDAPSAKTCTTCEVIAIVETKGDLAYAQSRWRDWGDESFSEYEEGPSASSESTVPGWDVKPGERRNGSMFLDRGVYKLGETAHLKGVLRTETATGLSVPKDLKEVELRVTDPQDLTIVKTMVKVSDTGAFDTTIKVPLGGAQGQYYVSAPGVSASFLVTSYRKPDFVVDVTVKKAEIVSGQVLNADVDARYLFGAPMAGAQQVTVLRPDSTYTSIGSGDKDLADYSFTFPCLDSSVIDCGPRAFNMDALARLEDPLNDVGHLTIGHAIPPVATRHEAYNVVVESDVADISRQTFADRKSVLVHPGTYYYGVKTVGAFPQAGKPLRAQIVSVTPDAKRFVGKKATVELVRWEWTLATRQNDDGTTSTVGSYRVNTVDTKQIITDVKPVEVSVTPPAAGMYELRVYGTDELGNAIESGLTTYAVGPGYVAWASYEDQPTLTIEADRASYRVGDTAHVLIRSPWEKAEGILTIERGGVLLAKRFSVTSSASAIDVPIDENARPNEFATVTLFAPPARARTVGSGGGTSTTGAPDTGAELNQANPQLLSAIVELSVPPVDRSLEVKVATSSKSYLPGADTTVDISVADAAGKAPAASEVTLWAVDEGILRLTGYTTPDLLAELYRARSNEVVTSDSRMRLAVIESDEKGDESVGSPSPGGGGGDSASTDVIRTDFRTLAVWSGAVKIGADGKASVPVKLPESLTAYRILAVATSGADRFGSTTGAVEVRKPFMLQPAVPRFSNVGDKFEAGVVVFNRTGTTGPVTVVATPDSGSAALGSVAPQTVTVPSVGDKPVEVRFTFTAAKAGQAKVVFSGSAGATGTPAARDAVSVSFPTTLTQRLAVVATSGTVTVSGGKTASAPTERIFTPPDALPGIGGLEVAASTSALAGLQNSIAALVEYPFGCLEQRTSRIRILLELSKLDRSFVLPELSKTRIDRVLVTEIRALRQFSTSSGGLSYWPGTDVADPFLTARTLVLLGDAKVAKLPVPAGMIRALTKALQGSVGKVVNDNPDESWRYDSEFDLGPVRSLAAFALARAGKPESALVDSLYDVRFELPFTERVNLLRAMLEAGETGERPNAMYADVLSSVRIENERAYVEDGYSYDNWPGLSYLDGGPTNSVVNTGSLLSLMTRTDPKHPLVAKLAKWLVDARTGGAWENTLENGVALTGLLDVATLAEVGNPDVRAHIALGTLDVLSSDFTGRSLDVQSKATGIERTIAAGRDFVASASGNGTVYWSARLRYAVPPARLKAIDQGFTLERKYTKYVPPSVGAGSVPSPSTTPTTVAAGRGTSTTVKPVTAGLDNVTFTAGDLVQVTLRITTAQRRNNVAVEDLLPAGLEALNAQLATTSAENIRNTSEGASDSEATDTSPWAAGINHTEIRDDRVLLFATALDPGSFTYTYVARATAPGSFVAPPAQVEEMYHPEVLGRTRASSVTIRPPAKP